jgi:hypothetical protein
MLRYSVCLKYIDMKGAFTLLLQMPMLYNITWIMSYVHFFCSRDVFIAIMYILYYG